MLNLWSLINLPVMILTFFATIRESAGSGLQLNSFISHFEPLFYSPKSLDDHIHRKKRSAKSEIRLQFTAHNKVFKLRMRTETSIFAPDVVFESSSRGKFDYDVRKVFKGHLDDDEDSSVEGVITSDGLLDAVVNTKLEQYFIEPSSRYFLESSRPFHSVIYKLSDVHFPLGNFTRKSPSLVPKSHGSYFSHQLMVTSPESVHSSATEINNYLLLKNHSSFTNPLSLTFQLLHKKKKSYYAQKYLTSGSVFSSNESETELYVRDGDALQYRDFEHYGDSERYGVGSNQRTHVSEDRTDRHVAIDLQKSTCMLYLQADHLFYQKMGSEEACIETITRHVQKVNGIYKNTEHAAE
ncbi:disintegrin and metalloproteinase domain-containing protein 10-like [Stegodyphus dumicola]|uniref:disintegrin and metalloproteinase domain-containing protein 10-like n=1 Tax=Stegodyphus dumicola TaxID=202533 RepID=UPI0015AE846C|nr:disintegrin and metalloproteinase domain-containing protein 10-like [Stegodyphus dumicola]